MSIVKTVNLTDASKAGSLEATAENPKYALLSLRQNTWQNHDIRIEKNYYRVWPS
jgi:hypothetical protein